MELAEFLESHPPGQIVQIGNLTDTALFSGNKWLFPIKKPEIQLHCENDRCNGIRIHRYISDTIRLEESEQRNCFIRYQCSNCQQSVKTYAIIIKHNTDGGAIIKLGEFPAFGPPMPSKLMKLIGPDRDEFLKGRRCENQGLGIGASVYYRRVVENQKNRILEEIKRVAIKLNAKAEVITLLDSAIKEIQFSKALELAKGGIPESLLINGQNPITLLHSALSEGVHNLSDPEFLEIASSVRIVLTELSERLSAALKDEAELNNALNKLMNRKKGS